MMPARACLTAAFLAATAIQGQQSVKVPVPTVAGVVRDLSGVPVSDVEVGVFRDNHLQQFVLTDAAGKFLLSGMGEGVVPVRFRRLGYAMQFKNIDSRIPTSSVLEIVLTTVPSELQDVTVAGHDLVKLHEFFEHRQQRASFGLFYEQSDIRRMGATQPSDLFRTVPGMVISTGSGGNVMRIRGCQPMVWVDGQRVPGAELDEIIHPQEIAAIEFYPSNAGVPPQYMERGNRLCGLVLVWTKTR